VPWYKTTKGQTIAAVSALILLVVILAMVSNSRKEAADLRTTQDGLENYTDQVSALLQRITTPASEMATAAQAPPEDLAGDAEQWVTMFTGAQTETSQFLAPEEATTASQLFTQAVNLYRASAETLAVAADLEGQAQADLVSAVSTQIQSASGVWEAAVSALDEARDDAELGASGLRSPTTAPPSGTQTPAPSATIPVEPEDDGGGGGGKSGGGKNNKKGDDS
jgi:hypothetical protein